MGRRSVRQVESFVGDSLVSLCIKLNVRSTGIFWGITYKGLVGTMRVRERGFGRVLCVGVDCNVFRFHSKNWESPCRPGGEGDVMEYGIF